MSPTSAEVAVMIFALLPALPPTSPTVLRPTVLQTSPTLMLRLLPTPCIGLVSTYYLIYQSYAYRQSKKVPSGRVSQAVSSIIELTITGIGLRLLQKECESHQHGLIESKKVRVKVTFKTGCNNKWLGSTSTSRPEE